MRSILKRTVTVGAIFLLIIGLFPMDNRSQSNDSSADSTLSKILIPASATMQQAWDLPRNPLTDSLPENKYLAERVKLGYRLFTETRRYAPRFTGNDMTCNNCHPNAGQREKFLPLVGVAGVFPEYSKRAGRMTSLEDRIVGCFERSLNSAGMKDVHTPRPESKEVLALSAYIAWLSEKIPAGTSPPWRGQNVIPKEKLIPIEELNPGTGKNLFLERCSNCHGENGQGVEIGDKKAGPLWGQRSWNDGAGAARTYTLAGIIRYAMPYLDPGNVTDEEAQQIAAYITSKQRPIFPFKKNDYLKERIPIDAVYYKQLYMKNPLMENHKPKKTHDTGRSG